LRKKESAVEVDEMYLENGRTMVQGIMVLVFATIAFLVDTTLGLGLVAIMGSGLLALRKSRKTQGPNVLSFFISYTNL
jgi:hypothetical protein